MLEKTTLGGKYRHYKNEKLYEVIAQARHSETQEEMIVYRALYHCDKFGDNQIWVRLGCFLKMSFIMWQHNIVAYGIET